MSQGDTGLEPTLVIKAPILQLKYLLVADRITLWLLRMDDGLIAYALEVPDDPQHPALLWSIAQNTDWITALQTLLHDTRCVLHLFNEIAVNVASTEVRFNFDADGIQALLTDARILHNEDPDAMRDTVSAILDDGAQQEALALWLTDSLTIEGAHVNPTVTAPSGSRELCDVIFGYDHGTFLIESKALNVLTRQQLPTRDELRGDVVKHVKKAVKQLGGAIRYLRLGYPVIGASGEALELDRESPMHLIILVPDLSLLSAADNLGGSDGAAPSGSGRDDDREAIGTSQRGCRP